MNKPGSSFWLEMTSENFMVKSLEKMGKTSWTHASFQVGIE
jgi:hypothetical protein